MGLRFTRLKPITWGPSDVTNPIELGARLGFPPNFIVVFNYSPTPSEHNGFMEWIIENTSGKAYSINRESLGPTGEVFFEYEEEALMFFLHHS